MPREHTKTISSQSLSPKGFYCYVSVDGIYLSLQRLDKVVLGMLLFAQTKGTVFTAISKVAQIKALINLNELECLED